MSKTTPTARKSSRRGSKTDSSTKHQSLETLTVSSSPVQLTNIKELRTYLQLAFLANPSVSPVIKLEKMIPEICGPKQSRSFAEYDHDSRSWRTYQVCLVTGTYDEYSETWPKQGSMQDGLVSEQTNVAHPTNEPDYGYWPTPTASTNGPGKDPNNPRGIHQGNSLATAVRMWPTPAARDYKDVGDNINLHRHERQNSQLGVVAKRTDPTGGSLNPNWVEWLMGWTIGWTDLKPLETDRFQEWLQQHGRS